MAVCSIAYRESDALEKIGNRLKEDINYPLCANYVYDDLLKEYAREELQDENKEADWIPNEDEYEGFKEFVKMKLEETPTISNYSGNTLTKDTLVRMNAKLSEAMTNNEIVARESQLKRVFGIIVQQYIDEHSSDPANKLTAMDAIRALGKNENKESAYTVIMRKVWQWFDKTFEDIESTKEFLKQSDPDYWSDPQYEAELEERAQYILDSYHNVMRKNTDILTVRVASAIGQTYGFAVKGKNLAEGFSETIEGYDEREDEAIKVQEAEDPSPTEGVDADTELDDSEGREGKDDNTGTDENDVKGDRFFDFRTTKLADTLTPMVRRIFNMMPRFDSYGNQMFDDFGLPLTLSAGQVVIRLQKILVGATSENMMQIIYDAINSTPWLKGVYEFLNEHKEYQALVYTTCCKSEFRYAYTKQGANGVYSTHLGNTKAANHSAMREAGLNMQAGTQLPVLNRNDVEEQKALYVYTSIGTIDGEAIDELKKVIEDIKTACRATIDIFAICPGKAELSDKLKTSLNRFRNGENATDEYDDIVEFQEKDGKLIAVGLKEGMTQEDLLNAILVNNPKLTLSIANTLRAFGFAVDEFDVLDTAISPIADSSLKFFAENLGQNKANIKNRFYCLVYGLGNALNAAENATKNPANNNADALYNIVSKSLTPIESALTTVTFEEIESRYVAEGKSLGTYNNINLLQQFAQTISNARGLSLEEYEQAIYDEFGRFEGMAIHKADGTVEYTGFLKYIQQLINLAKERQDETIISKFWSQFQVINNIAFNHVEYKDMNPEQIFTNAIVSYFNQRIITNNNNGMSFLQVPLQGDYDTAYDFISMPIYDTSVNLEEANAVKRKEARDTVVEKAVTSIYEVISNGFNQQNRLGKITNTSRRLRTEDDIRNAISERVDVLLKNSDTQAAFLEQLADDPQLHEIYTKLFNEYEKPTMDDAITDEYLGDHFGLYYESETKDHVKLKHYAPIVEEFVSEVLCEIERIKSIKKRIANRGNNPVLAVYERRGVLFSLFDNFNKNGFLEEYEKLLKSEKGVQRANDYVHDMVVQELVAMLQDDIAKTNRLGILGNKNLNTSKSKSDASVNDTLSEKELEERGLTKGTFEALTNKAKKKFINFLVNKKYAHYQFMKVAIGGSWNFANLSDEEKRMMFCHATHTSYYSHAMIEVNGKYEYVNNMGVSDYDVKAENKAENDRKKQQVRTYQNAVYITDEFSPAAKTKHILNILNVLLEEGRITQAQFDQFKRTFENICVTDGMAWRTFDSYRATMDSLGKWTKQMEKSYHAIRSGTYTFEDVDVFMQNLKLVYTGHEIVTMEDGTVVKLPVLHKYSEMVLLPLALAQTSPLAQSIPLMGLELARAELAREHGIVVDVFLTHSDVKVGSHSIIDVTSKDENGNRILRKASDISNKVVSTITSNPYTIHRLDHKGLGIAASTDAHITNTRIASASQAENVSMANIQKGDSINLENSSSCIKNAVVTDEKGETRPMDAMDARDLYFKLKATSISRAYKELVNIFGNPERLQAVVSEELGNMPHISQEVKFALMSFANGSTALPYYAPSIQHQVQQLMSSIIKKRLTKQMIKGANILQSSSFGIDSEIELTKFESEEALRKIADPEGKRKDFENAWGTISEKFDKKGNFKYMEVYMTINDDRLLAFADKNGAISRSRLRFLVNNGIIPESALNFIAYRTPSDAEHSVIPCRIVGFIPKSSGATIVTPKVAMCLTGHDFDGDKLRCHFKEFNFVSTHESNKGKRLSGKDIKKIRESIYKEKKIYANLDGFIEVPSYDASLSIDENFNMKDGKVASSNAMVDIMFSILTSKKGAQRLFIPGGTPTESYRMASILTIMRQLNKHSNLVIEYLKNYRNKEGELVFTEEELNKNLKVGWKAYDLLQKLNLKTLNEIEDIVGATEDPGSMAHAISAHEYVIQSGQMIDVYAMYNSIFARLQRAGLRFTRKAAKGKVTPGFLNCAFSENICDVFNAKGQHLLYALARLLNCAVDNNKYPVLGKLHQTKELANFTAWFLALGQTEENIHLFFNQPAIIELNARLAKRDARSFDATVAEMLAELKAAYENLDSDDSSDSWVIDVERTDNNEDSDEDIFNFDISRKHSYRAVKWLSKNTGDNFSIGKFLKDITFGYADVVSKDNKSGNNGNNKVSKAMLLRQAAFLQFLSWNKEDAGDFAELVKLLRPDSSSGGIGAKIEDVLAKSFRLEAFIKKLQSNEHPAIEGIDVRWFGYKKGADGKYGMLSVEESLETALPEVSSLNTMLVRSTLALLATYFPAAKQTTNNIDAISWYEAIQEISHEYNTSTVYPSNVAKIISDMMLWKLMSHPGFSQDKDIQNGDDREAILQGVPERLSQLKKRINDAHENAGTDKADPVAERFYNNQFLNKLVKSFALPGSDATRLRFQMNGAPIDGTSDTIRGFWADMIVHGDEEIRQLAVDLLKYTIYASGFNFGMYGFQHFAPFIVMENAGNYLEALSSIIDTDWTSEEIQEFMHQYYMNHWNDYSLVHRFNMNLFDDNIVSKRSKAEDGTVTWTLNVRDMEANMPGVINDIVRNRYILLTTYNDGKQESYLFRVVVTALDENNDNQPLGVTLVLSNKLGEVKSNKQVSVQYSPWVSYTDMTRVETISERELAEIQKRKEKLAAAKNADYLNMFDPILQMGSQANSNLTHTVFGKLGAKDALGKSIAIASLRMETIKNLRQTALQEGWEPVQTIDENKKDDYYIYNLRTVFYELNLTDAEMKDSSGNTVRLSKPKGKYTVADLLSDKQFYSEKEIELLDPDNIAETLASSQDFNGTFNFIFNTIKDRVYEAYKAKPEVFNPWINDLKDKIQGKKLAIDVSKPMYALGARLAAYILYKEGKLKLTAEQEAEIKNTQSKERYQVGVTVESSSNYNSELPVKNQNVNFVFTENAQAYAAYTEFSSTNSTVPTSAKPVSLHASTGQQSIRMKDSVTESQRTDKTKVNKNVFGIVTQKAVLDADGNYMKEVKDKVFTEADYDLFVEINEHAIKRITGLDKDSKIVFPDRIGFTNIGLPLKLAEWLAKTLNDDFADSIQATPVKDNTSGMYYISISPITSTDTNTNTAETTTATAADTSTDTGVVEAESTSTFTPDTSAGFDFFGQALQGSKTKITSGSNGSNGMSQLVYVDEEGNVQTGMFPANASTAEMARKQRAAQTLYNKLKAILESRGISIGVLENFADKAISNGVALFDAVRVSAEAMVEGIKLAEGEAGVLALPEEAAHMFIEMLGRDHPLVQRLVDALFSSEEALREAFGVMYDKYMEKYAGDRTTMVFEAAGKLVAKHLLREQEISTSLIRRIIARISDAIKALLRRFSKNEITNAIWDAEGAASRMARNILNGNLVNEMSRDNITADLSFYNLKKDITGKKDILHKLLKIENKRLALLKKRAANKNAATPAAKIAAAQEISTKAIEEAIANNKVELTIVNYLNTIANELPQLELMLENSVKNSNNTNIICYHLNQMRDTIYGYKSTLQQIRESIVSGEVQDSHGISSLLSNVDGVLNKLNTKYTMYAKQCLEALLESVYGKNGIRMEVGKYKGKVISIKEMANYIESDISFASRWFNAAMDCNDFILKAVDDTVRNAKMRSRRRSGQVRPMIEAAVADLIRETGSRDQNFMFETVVKNGKTVRTGRYITAEEAKKLSPAKQKFYNTMMDIKRQADDCLPPTVVPDHRKMVMMRKYMMEKIKSAEGVGNKLLATWDGVKNMFLEMSEDFDPDYKEVAVDFQGNKVDRLAIKFVNKGAKESYEDMTDDVASSILSYAGMAFEYDELNAVVNIIENAKYMSAEREVVKKAGNRKMRETIDTDVAVSRDPFTQKAATTHIQNALVDFINMHVYGHTRADEGTFGRTKISKRKVTDSVNHLTSLAIMAVNLPNRISNVVNGRYSVVLETVSKNGFGYTDTVWASGVYMQHAANRLAGSVKTESDDKLSLFMEHFDFHQNNGRSIPEYGKKNISRIFNESMLYSGLAIGEDYLAGITALSCARNINVKNRDGQIESLWDAYEVAYVDPENKTGAFLKVKDGYTLEDGSAIDARVEDNFAKKVYALNFKMQGIYNLDDKSPVQQYAAGALIILYRKWIAPSLKRRYGVGQYNALTREQEEGFYRTGWGLIVKSFQDAKDAVSEEESANFIHGMCNSVKAFCAAVEVNWNNMTPFEKANCKKAMVELMVLGGLYLSCALLTKLPPVKEDDDKTVESWFIKTGVSQLLKLRAELGSIAPTPGLLAEAYRVIKSPTAAIGPIRDTFNILQLMVPTNYATEIKSGRYKGHKKAYKYLMEFPMLSMYKKMQNFLDPTPLINYYNNIDDIY